MTLRMNGATSGYTEIDAPAVAGSNTLTLPGGNGSADQALVTNGSGTLSFADRGRMVLETAKSATGTFVDFTSIPSWVKRVTVMMNGVSTNGTSSYLVQIGSGSFTTSGYLSNHNYVNNSANSCTGTSSTQGFLVANDVGAATVYGGICTLATLGSNAWAASGTMNRGSGSGGFFAGTVTLSGTLDRVRITTVNGTDTFDAGTINLLLEG